MWTSILSFKIENKILWVLIPFDGNKIYYFISILFKYELLFTTILFGFKFIPLLFQKLEESWWILIYKHFSHIIYHM